VRDAKSLARVAALSVPPAWRDVHVASSARSAIQAWGCDARGRKQYVYHDRAVEQRDLRKYHRMRQLAKELPQIRRALHRHAASRKRAADLDAETVAATVLCLISETFGRIGSERYAEENGTIGITTLKKSHVELADGIVSFSYTGKSNKTQRQVVIDPALVRLVRRQMRTPGARLFRYRRGGGWRVLTARDVNAYLRREVDGRFSAKDFRTWGGTLRAATVLAELGPPGSPSEGKRNVALAMRLVSSELGNTPAICRKSYVHPMIVARYLDEGKTIPLPRARRKAANRGTAHSPEERGLIRFLDEHFPERRKSERDHG
jgi:DNA topoisomerase-1